MEIQRAAACILGALLLACGSDQAATSQLSGATGCERFASLADLKGCSPPSSCNIRAACEEPAIEWVNCAATDLDQCICESDGDLNCEGSYKANEGPAHCVAAYQAFSA